jgi:Spy/CpxP family protein refolding chaperone
MRQRVVIYALLLSFLIAPPLCAQNSYTEFERGLNLSDSQRMRAEGVREKYINNWRSMRHESMRKRIELRELQRNPRANQQRIDRTQRELQNLQRSRDMSYKQYRSEVSRVLNERQRRQYNNFTDSERRNRMGGPHHRMRRYER